MPQPEMKHMSSAVNSSALDAKLTVCTCVFSSAAVWRRIRAMSFGIPGPLGL